MTSSLTDLRGNHVLPMRAAFPHVLSLISALVCAACHMPVALDNRLWRTYEEEVDLSSVGEGGNVAVILGQTDVTYPLDYDCWLVKPARAKRVIVDPGPVEITANCDAPNGSLMKSIAFESEPNHTYRVDRPHWKWCLELTDITAEKLVAEVCQE